MGEQECLSLPLFISTFRETIYVGQFVSLIFNIYLFSCQSLSINTKSNRSRNPLHIHFDTYDIYSLSGKGKISYITLPFLDQFKSIQRIQLQCKNVRRWLWENLLLDTTPTMNTHALFKLWTQVVTTIYLSASKGEKTSSPALNLLHLCSVKLSNIAIFENTMSLTCKESVQDTSSGFACCGMGQQYFRNVHLSN